MMTADVRAVLNRIADDLLAVAHAVLEDDSISYNRKTGKNTLKDSALNGDLFATISETTGDSPIIRAFFNNYVAFLEWDRPPRYGKQPPISALVDWANKNGIPSDAGTLWAISYAIWRDGHEGRPIFAKIAETTDELFTKDWGDQLRDAITKEIDLFFTL